MTLSPPCSFGRGLCHEHSTDMAGHWLKQRAGATCVLRLQFTKGSRGGALAEVKKKKKNENKKSCMLYGEQSQYAFV